MTRQEPSEQQSTHNPDRLKAFAGLLGDVSLLMTEIEATHIDPHGVENENGTLNPTQHFSFEIIGSDAVELSERVKNLIPDLDQISISLGRDTPAEPTSLSVELNSPTRSLTISRSGNPEDEAEFDYLLDLDISKEIQGTKAPQLPPTQRKILQSEPDDDFAKRITPINKVSKTELNTLIASLIYPNPEKDYGAFSLADFTSAKVYDSLSESLQLAALNNFNASMYEFSQSETKFSYFKVDSQPLSFTIHYPEEKTGRIITAHSNLETDFRLMFNTYEITEHPVYTNLGKTLGTSTVEEGRPYFPSTEEIEYIRTLIADEIHSLVPTAVEAEEALVDETTPEKAFEESGRDALIYSDKYVQDMLDKLDGDGQNPAA